MFEKLKLFISLFRQGSAVANPAAWKNGQITANKLAAFFAAIVAVANYYGYRITLDDGTAMAISVGIVTAFNWVLTITTSKTVGLPIKPDAVLDPAGAEASAMPPGTSDPLGGGGVPVIPQPSPLRTDLPPVSTPDVEPQQSSLP